MKVVCSFCGIHFKQDFDLTLQMPCNFWGERGLGNLPLELKRELWDWMFNCPTDKVFILTGIGLGFNLTGVPVPDETKFEKMVKNWAELSEEQKQQFQKEFFKGKIPYQGVPIMYGEPGR